MRPIPILPLSSHSGLYAEMQEGSSLILGLSAKNHVGGKEGPSWTEIPPFHSNSITRNQSLHRVPAVCQGSGSRTGSREENKVPESH